VILPARIAFLRNKLEYLERCASGSAPVVRVPIARRLWLLTNAADVQHVLRTHPERYMKGSGRTSAAGRRLAGQGVLTLDGAAHLERKRLLQPTFAAAALAPAAAAVVETAHERSARWADGAVVDLASEMMALAQDVAGRVLLGRDYDGHDGLFAAAVRERRRYIQYWFDYPLPGRERLPIPIVWRHRAALRTMRQTLAAAIARRRITGGQDWLAMAIAARDPDGSGLTDTEILEEAQTFALTGYETVGEALAWTWHLLALAPQVKTTLEGEAHAVLGTRNVVADDAARLPYTRQVIYESMRLFPPTWLFTRTAREADDLPSGFHVPCGGALYLSPWIVHRRAEYFPDPARFDPARFSDDGRAGRPEFAYFPFGGGRHACIGQAMARVACVLAIATLVRTHRFVPVPGHEVRPVPGITLTPRGGLPMTVVRRAAPHA
jgi:cytochrome P450